MRSALRRWHVLSAIVFSGVVGLPIAGYAQEASILGTIVDSSGALLPGVTITTTHEATGTSAVTTSDARGGFQLPVRVGVYTVSAQLDGFGTVTQSGLTVLVGQQVVIKLTLMPASVQENVVVTGEAPLVNTTQSAVTSNVDSRQLTELPVNGRNWVDLTMLAVGARANNVAEIPLSNQGNFQLNLDGQQVTMVDAAQFGQPRYSEDAIAEFAVVANRFDATQGHSGGIQVNAITKSGTNMFVGTNASYFRSDKFNSKDFIANRVLPFSNQQVSTTFGGPIIKDKFHFFANYEYERQPHVFTFNSPYPSFNIDQAGKDIQHKLGGRLDYQVSSRTRFSLRGTNFDADIPFDPRFSGGATRHPSAAIEQTKHSTDLILTATQLLSNRAANEIRTGWAAFYYTLDSVVPWPSAPNGFQNDRLKRGAPVITMQGYTFGIGNSFTPQYVGQDVYSVRDDLTYTFEMSGRHTLKTGGEFLYNNTFNIVSPQFMGTYDATLGPRPANLEALFPVWNDPTTWNLNALNPLIRTYQVGIGNGNEYVRRHQAGFWVQDDWTPTQRLTVNLGFRYDWADHLMGEEIVVQPFKPTTFSPQHDVVPRLGAAYTLDDKTVIRGGWGKFVGDVSSTVNLFTVGNNQFGVAQVVNDGRPDFATNPFNGPIPTFEQIKASGVRRTVTQAIAAPGSELPFTYQSSIGFQRQIGSSMSVQADYVDNRERNAGVSRNINLAFNPTTGINVSSIAFASLPFPTWGNVQMRFSDGKTNYHALQTALTKRFSNHWQAQATYTYAREYNFQPLPINAGCQYPMTVALVAGGTPTCNTPITLAPDLQAQWYETGQQHHRLVFNGIWESWYGIQVSGLYFYADNGRDQITAGVDPRVTGSTSGRVRADGSLIPFFSFNRADLHRVDMRLSRKFQLSQRVSVSGVFDVFNLFNHKNYGTYVVNERNSLFGQPTTDNGTAYQPRNMQIGFRLTF